MLTISMEEHGVALLLTLIAGLSTGIGSAVALFAHTESKRFLSVSLGFSAGIMIYVSFVELLAKANDILVIERGHHRANVIVAIAFFAGILLIAIIDRLIPSYENPHEAHSLGEMSEQCENHKLMRTGVLTALAIGIHNFPEGIATVTASISDMRLGISVAVAIALHNIPEGIAVAVPIYCATKSRKKAFWLSFLSGLSEPIGAVIGLLIMSSFFSQTLFGCVLASVAGIMVFISLDELIPTAREYGEGHLAIYGTVSGMAVMALSLVLFS